MPGSDSYSNRDVSKYTITIGLYRFYFSVKRTEEQEREICSFVLLSILSYLLLYIIRISDQYEEQQSDRSYHLSGMEHLVCIQFHVARSSDTQGDTNFACQQMGSVGCSALAMMG